MKRRFDDKLVSLLPGQIATAAEYQKRAVELGGQIDGAILQALRERLWSGLIDRFDAKEVGELVGLILGLRRLELAERKLTSGEGETKALSLAEQKRVVRQIFGMAPAPLTANGQVSNVKYQGTTNQ